MQRSDFMDERKKTIIWDEWRDGSSKAKISQKIKKPPATVFSYLRYDGGIRPRQRTRSSLSLSLEEREEISRGLAVGRSLRSIAVLLGRSSSTISREVSKNGGRAKYRTADADKAAWKRARRPKQYALAKNTKLKRLVVRKLSEDWSSEQISGWLKLDHPDDETLRVPHETIYKSLFIQTRGLFRKEMRNHLRTKRKFRHSKNFKASPRGQIIGAISIADRPADVEGRAVPGTGREISLVEQKTAI